MSRAEHTLIGLGNPRGGDQSFRNRAKRTEAFESDAVVQTRV